jgi:hypothetical protein
LTLIFSRRNCSYFKTEKNEKIEDKTIDVHEEMYQNFQNQKFPLLLVELLGFLSFGTIFSASSAVQEFTTIY